MVVFWISSNHLSDRPEKHKSLQLFPAPSILIDDPKTGVGSLRTAVSAQLWRSRGWNSGFMLQLLPQNTEFVTEMAEESIWRSKQQSFFFCQNSTSNMWWCLEFWSFGVPKNLRKSSSWENMSHLFSWASHLWNFCKFCQGPVPVVIQGPGTCAEKKWLGGGFKYLLFSPLVGPVGEMIQFD